MRPGAADVRRLAVGVPPHRRPAVHLRNRLVVLSASTLPPVWQVGQ